MGLDTLIFLIVAGIVVISQIRKMKAPNKRPKRPDATKQPEKTADWKSTISDLFTDVSAEMERARTEAETRPETGAGGARPGRKTGWEDLIPTERYQPEPSEDIRRPEAVVEAPEPEPLSWPMESEADMELTPTERMREQRAKSAGRRMAARCKGTPPWHDPRGMTVRQLRHAIIWSEILAPPVGLRDLDR